MKAPTNGVGAASAVAAPKPCEEKKSLINQELWQACAGPLVNLPPAGTHVVYFPQGHSEQVAASMTKDVDAQIPNYPNLPSKLLCLLLNVTLHADPETDEVYAQMILQPVPTVDKDALLRSDLALKSNKPQPEFFCKTLTASDTSTHGGFSVPRRAAEKIFPPLDFSMRPPAQELVARDLHDNLWTFRHIYRGQPKRHLLTTGWSLFVSGKRLFAGDSVLFIRDEKQQLLLGIRRANRQPTNLSSSVLSSDSMHIGILAAAAHAAANNSPFTVFYNPRASPSEFVIPLAKYYKSVFGNQLSLGMRFRMMFETEESGTRRYMGTITGITDLDPLRWKNSQWRNLQIGWDESTAGERRNRVSIWEIEPVTAPFFICPPPFFRSKRPRQPGMPDDESDIDNMFKRTMPWLGEDFGSKDDQGFPGLSLVQWMNMQQNPIHSNHMNSFTGSALQNLSGPDLSRQLGMLAPQIPHSNHMQFNPPTLPPQQTQQQQLDQIPKLPSPMPTQQLNDVIQQQRQNMVGQSQTQTQTSNMHMHHNNQIPRSLAQNLQHQQQHQNIIPSQPDQMNQQFQQHMSDNQLQFLQKLQQQHHQSMLAQQSSQQITQIHDQQRQLVDPSRSLTPTQIPDIQQNMINTIAPQISKNNFSQPNTRFSRPTEMPGRIGILTHPSTNQVVTGGSVMLTGVTEKSGVTDDVPSCSTSPSTNNCSNVVQPRNRVHRGTVMAEEIPPQKSEVKPSLSIPRSQSQGIFASHNQYMNGAPAQTDYLDTSSSTTSVGLSQNDMNLHHNNNAMPFNPQSMLFREASQDRELQVDQRNNASFGNNIDGQLGVSINPDPPLLTGKMIGNYENLKDTQQELSSSMVSQSFGVPDIAFDTIDSTINDGSFLNPGPWAPATQFQRLRTYTKVYKRGAVGRSIDMSRYSDYDDLKRDLARRFGIEGQLEDRQRVGWKLVYVDHENDVLLVGDDPWQEFVNCVRCIKILSPQEVQQMSLDGDFGGGGILPNQACSSSDGVANG